jgi:hypothetical protein
VTVTHGTNVVLGLAPDRIAEIPDRIRTARRNVVPPLWDGQAGDRAAAAIEGALHAERQLAPALLRAASAAAVLA